MSKYVHDDELCNDNNRLRDNQRSRRAETNLSLQEEANRVKSEYCDIVKKKRGNEVNERIMALYDTDRKLYNYIRNLENICGSVWCLKCSDMIRLPKLPHGDLTDDIEACLLSSVGVPPSEDVRVAKLNERINKLLMLNDGLKAKLDIECANTKAMKTKLTECNKKVTLLQEQLAALHESGIPQRSKESSTVTSTAASTAASAADVPMPLGNFPTINGMRLALIPIYLPSTVDTTEGKFPTGGVFEASEASDASKTTEAPQRTMTDEEFNAILSREIKSQPCDYDLRTPLTTSDAFFE